MSTQIQQVIKLARSKGLLRPRDLAEIGVPRQYLSLACKQGVIEQIGRGLYSLPGAMTDERRSLAEVGKQVPKGVICLLSALQYHEITTQMPHEVWLAIGEKDRKPKLDTVRVRTVRFSGPAFSEGIERHDFSGVACQIYNPAKTIADCFKYRNKIGIDVCIEALRDGLRQRKCTIDELVHYGRICRVEKLMAPYIEAII
jgi:predicted transcriptional regulator of viral defense system